MSDSNNIKIGKDLLAEGKFDEAKDFFTDVIQSDPTVSDAYVGRLLASLELSSEDMLAASSTEISENDDYIKALTFADDDRKKELEEIAEVLRDTNVAILSDEIYAELTYGRKHVSIASIEGMRERTIIASGFSKA